VCVVSAGCGWADFAWLGGRVVGWVGALVALVSIASFGRVVFWACSVPDRASLGYHAAVGCVWFASFRAVSV